MDVISNPVVPTFVFFLQQPFTSDYNEVDSFPHPHYTAYTFNNFQLLCYFTCQHFLQIHQLMQNNCYQFIYFGSNISSTKSLDRLSPIWKFDFSDKTKDFMQTIPMSVQQLHQLDANETLVEKTRWDLQEDASSYFQKYPGSSTLQKRSCTATNDPKKNSLKFFTYLVGWLVVG